MSLTNKPLPSWSDNEMYQPGLARWFVVARLIGTGCETEVVRPPDQSGNDENDSPACS
jgi:hypothetical protein